MTNSPKLGALVPDVDVKVKELLTMGHAVDVPVESTSMEFQKLEGDK